MRASIPGRTTASRDWSTSTRSSTSTSRPSAARRAAIPATYTGAFTPIREWFAGLPEAKAARLRAGPLLIQRQGRALRSACQGDGVIKIEMHFLPDVYVTCDVCKGKRYNRETLEVKLQRQVGRRRARHDGGGGVRVSSRPCPSIRDKLETLARVGLGYIHIGQQATTLSGGEAQRIKLAKGAVTPGDGAHPIHSGRTDHGPALPRRRQAARGAARAGRRRQYRWR